MKPLSDGDAATRILGGLISLALALSWRNDVWFNLIFSGFAVGLGLSVALASEPKPTGIINGDES